MQAVSRLVQRASPARKLLSSSQVAVPGAGVARAFQTGEVIQDLRVLGRRLEHVMLVDDKPLVCGACNADNVLNCAEYLGDKKGEELFAITAAL
ncbi:hypothetical protein H310_01508 [Aphanomyces invadans]|uniref:FCP1 homology domain-containing protein n=1 Tax=Aphanomyces invadans TaxID=157072 RepID=A0A024USV9_9STRA|nr:hypothetical protein H310_01508 [Aphanomyces invadans]ETW09040.1 hypothetical protein H310_01508 [Aphanomyces invadans]|eukprot:XP_008862845.1 hypothetical protein H310_01508 [Aphanomyces invadans]